jgi:hypothetical protein
VKLEVSEASECLHDLLANRADPVHEDGVHHLKLEPFGYRWFKEERSRRNTVQVYQGSARVRAPAHHGSAG